MTTYKQGIKDRSRKIVWSKAVAYLTTDRESSKVLNPEYIQNLWEYCFTSALVKYGYVKKFNRKHLAEWQNFASRSYGTKTSKDLKIAYLCGPEPENDIRHLVKLGILIENIWAIESDENSYNKALNSARKNFTSLKIFKGKIEDFIALKDLKFDIFYCDFTKPLFSKDSRPLHIIHQLMLAKKMENLSVLILNSCVPDSTEENIDFLSRYFLFQPKVLYSVINKNAHKGTFSDPLSSEGINTVSHLSKIIKNNFGEAYSFFATQYPVYFGAKVIAAHSSIFSKPLERILLNKAEIDKGLNLFTGDGVSFGQWAASIKNASSSDKWGPGYDFNLSPHEFPYQWFLKLLSDQNAGGISKYWNTYFNSQKEKFEYSVSIHNLLRSSLEGYFPLLSPQLINALRGIIAKMPDKIGKSIFCDISFPHLWIEMAINQFGGAYHTNTAKLIRQSYTAKEREMNLDLFVFDRCLPLYDWLPFFELYEDFFGSIEKQMIVRSCINAISRQAFDLVPSSYRGSNLIGIYDSEYRWANVPNFPSRKSLN